MSGVGLTFALLAAAAAASPVAPDEAAIDSFVRQASTALHRPVRIDAMRWMGRNEAVAHAIVEQVMDGRKRATVARRAEYTDNGWKLPQAGQTVLVYDFAGKPSFIYRVVAAQELPLRSMASWHLMAESPALRDLAAWRTAHLGAWKAATEGLSAEQIDALPLVWMRFEPIFPAASPPR